jgi:hexosaminidase
VDPTLNSTWNFMDTLFSELATVFPNQYFHLGGDEVPFDCWASNPAIQAWMVAMGFGTNYALLENYYEQQLLDLVGGLNKSYIVWQEVFDNGVKIRPDTVVHAWKGGSTAAGLAELELITAAGFRGILSAGWYLNYIAYGPTWQTYYTADPQNFSGTAAQKALVVGGEVGKLLADNLIAVN